MPLQQINLIVGKNASGKSRAMNVMNGLARCLTGVERVPIQGEFLATFSAEGDTYKYSLRAKENKVIEESFQKGDHFLLSRREGGFGRMFFAGLNEEMDFHAPPETIASSTRADIVQAPYLLPLIDWAREVYFYPCSTDLGKNTVHIVRPDAPAMDPKDPSQTVPVFREGERRFGPAFTNGIIRDMATIGYELTALTVGAPQTIQLNPPMDSLTIFVREQGVGSAFDQFAMSVGMYRALAIIIHLNFALLDRKAQCFIIDDIGEGLDFDRSSALIQVVVDKVQASPDTQLIMTTNDRNVMNGVDLEYWSVLSRQGSEVFPLTKANRPKEFEEFRYTGLSNFDLLARNFLSDPL